MAKLLLTGGHLSPLLAVLAELPKDIEPVVIGRKYTFEKDKTESLEYQLLLDLKIPFYDVGAGRLQRKMSRKTIPSLLRSPSAFLKARKILKSEKPDAVLTFGGYIGLPVALAAYTLKIPVVLHEQTLHAGLTSKQIGRWAKKVCISYPTSEKYFNAKKTVFTGNPVRKEVFTVKDKIEGVASGTTLFVTGGSTGAHPINEIIENGLEEFLNHFVIIHQTGDAQEFKDFERLENRKKSLPENLQKKYALRKFILPEEIGWVYKNADVILARSGINTVTELVTLSKKALLVPLPYGQANEQLENAKYYAKTGLGGYIKQDDATPDMVLQKLLEIEKNKTSATALPKDNTAAQNIINVVREALI